MRYTTMKLTDFPKLLRQFEKKPGIYRTNLTMPEDGSVVIAPGTTDKPKEIPAGCVVVEAEHPGGTLVGFKDGVTLIIFDYEKPNWCADLIIMLQERGLDAKMDHNDVVIDGRKVCAYTSKPLGTTGLSYYACHIPIYVDLALMKRICAKTMKKVPQGLSHFGITRQDVLDALHIE